jgi:hypothetical protein
MYPRTYSARIQTTIAFDLNHRHIVLAPHKPTFDSKNFLYRPLPIHTGSWLYNQQVRRKGLARKHRNRMSYRVWFRRHSHHQVHRAGRCRMFSRRSWLWCRRRSHTFGSHTPEVLALDSDRYGHFQLTWLKKAPHLFGFVSKEPPLWYSVELLVL